MRQPPLVEVAVAAVHAVTHGLGHQPTGVDEQRMPLTHHLAKGIVGQVAFGWRHELRRGLRAGHLQLRLVFHGDRRGLGAAHGQQQQGCNHQFHGVTSWLAGRAKNSATALISSSVMALATPTISWLGSLLRLPSRQALSCATR
ncbi:hypothetical protein D3C80_1331700 [compost metagenome]